MVWQLQETWALINFAHGVKAHNNICSVYTKFNALSYAYSYRFLGGAYRFTWFGALSQHNSLTKVVYAYFDRISYIIEVQL